MRVAGANASFSVVHAALKTSEAGRGATREGASSMNNRLALRAAAPCVALFLSLAAFAATPERPIGTTIFQFGSEDDNALEFTATDFTCQVGVDCATASFPRELELYKGIGDYPAMGVTRGTIDFELKEGYPDLVLRLARTGVETLQVVIDGARAYRVTSEMLGSHEGFIGAYNLDLGALPQGPHSVTFTLVDEHRPDSTNDAFGWDALALIAPWDVTPSAHGRIEQIVVHGDSLEGDLLGDSPDRTVSVYLPPGYDRHTEVRYPALYLLHGIDATNTLWVGEGYLRGLNIATVADTLISTHRMQPMIIVMPDASNRYGGSFYTDSPVTGNWDEFVARDLVAYVDTHFRTIARPESRGRILGIVAPPGGWRPRLSSSQEVRHGAWWCVRVEGPAAVDGGAQRDPSIGRHGTEVPGCGGSRALLEEVRAAPDERLHGSSTGVGVRFGETPDVRRPGGDFPWAARW